MREADANARSSETVEVGSDNGLENVVLYISDWSGAPQKSNNGPGIRSKELHVYAACLGDGCGRRIQSDHQRSDHAQHPPAAQSDDRQYPMESVPAPGAAPIEKSWKAPEMHSGECNIHPWMHGWFVVVKGPYATTDDKGAYTINNVPPGSYTVTAWQEDYGTQTAKVTVAAGGSGTADFTFKAK